MRVSWNRLFSCISRRAATSDRTPSPLIVFSRFSKKRPTSDLEALVSSEELVGGSVFAHVTLLVAVADIDDSEDDDEDGDNGADDEENDDWRGSREEVRGERGNEPVAAIP